MKTIINRLSKFRAVHLLVLAGLLFFGLLCRAAIFSSGDINAGGNLTVTNNLTVQGTATLADLQITTLTADAFSFTNVAVANSNMVILLDSNTNAIPSASLLLPSTAVAGLGTPATGTFPMRYCSDVLTSRGTGGFVEWDGTYWRTREGVVATADAKTFILNCLGSGLTANTPISTIGVSRQLAATSQTTISQPPLARNFAVAGGGAAETFTAIGAFQWAHSPSVALVSGTTSTGSSSLWGTMRPAMASGDYLASGGAYSVSAAPDGTDNYWAMVGMSASANPATIPTTGAFFLYDPYTNSIGALYAAAITYTNNWICVMANSSTYTFADSGFPVEIDTTPTNRLMVVATTAGCYFYTNGVLSQTMTTAGAIPTTAIYVLQSAIKKTAGTTSRNLYEATPFVHIRQGAASPYP